MAKVRLDFQAEVNLLNKDELDSTLKGPSRHLGD